MEKVIELLLGSWIGVLSLFTILFMVGMAIFLVIFMRKHMKEPDQK